MPQSKTKWRLPKRKSRSRSDNVGGPFYHPGLKEEISRLDNEIRELDSRMSSGNESDKKRFEYDRDGKRREIDQKKRDLESLEKEINETRIVIQRRIEKGNRCRHARLEVQKIFLRAETTQNWMVRAMKRSKRSPRKS
jgi:transposase